MSNLTVSFQMNVSINVLLFGWYPYISLAVFLIGGWLRFDGAPHWQRESSGGLWRFGPLASGAALFHAGILVLLLGHLVGLLTPIEAFEAIGISHGLKQTLADVIGGGAGGIALVGLILMLRHGRSGASERPKRSFGDVAILLLILVQLGLGLSTVPYAVVNYASGCGALPFMWWAQSIITLKPGMAIGYANEIPLLFKLHMLNGMTIMLALPFTRLVNTWGIPVLIVSQMRRIPRRHHLSAGS